MLEAECAVADIDISVISEVSLSLDSLTKQFCETCRWWERRDDWSDEGDCERINCGPGHKTAETLARIYPVGSVGYLNTFASFGCRLWEAKKDQITP